MSGAGSDDLPGAAGAGGSPVGQPPESAPPSGGTDDAPTAAPTLGSRAGRPRRRWRRRLLWTGGVLALVVVLGAAAIGAYLWHLNSEIHRVVVKDLSAPPTTPRNSGDAPPENILLVGSTSRCALKVQNPAYGLCAQGVTGVNSDVIMIIHLVPATNRVTLLSIPRDTFVPNARIEGPNKVDAALYEGPNQLVDAIQEDFGISIQHYVELNFDTFAGVVNALGGVRMYFPMPVYDAYSGLKVLTPGCRYLNGYHALQVVRARHLQYKGPGVTSEDPSTWPQEAQSDLARIRRDHEFLRVLAAAVAKKGIGNPIVDAQIASAVAPDLTVDSKLSATDVAHLMLTFHSVDPGSVPQYTLPVSVATFPSGYLYEGVDYGDVVFPVEPEDQKVIDRFLGVTAATDTMTGGPLPGPAAVRVAVLGGTGDPAQPLAVAAGLRKLGFRVVETAQASPVSYQAAQTVVYYRSRSDEAQAQAVQRSLRGFVVMAKDPSMVLAGSTVTVVAGTAASVVPPTRHLAPAGTSSPTATTGPPSSTTAPSSPAVTGFQPPTVPVEPLAPWDPRSCTASGGEGP